MAKRMLADVLWEAANCQLWTGAKDDTGQEFTCLAAVQSLKTDNYRGSGGVYRLLESLGCETFHGGYTFGQRRGPKRQGVRYMWLLLAMHVAESEGIEVDA